MAVPYKNPISSVQVSTPLSVSRTSVFGTNFSNLNVGGYMEVYNLSDLSLTLTATTYPTLIQLSANTIPIRYTKGNGTFLSPDYLTLNSDNISSGRRRLGMLVYVHETDKVYQYVIPNYDTLWNNMSGLTGFSSVTYSDYTTVINSRSSAGQSFISGWTSSNIEGVGGFTSTNSNWRILQSGGGGGASGDYLPLSGGTVSGATIFTSGLTATTISATTYQNLPIKYYAEFSGSPSVNPSVTSSNSIAIGSGARATASDMFVVGQNAGSGSTSATHSIFIGSQSGLNVTSVNNSNFLGQFAGRAATSASDSNFLGNQAGLQSTSANDSNFLGRGAGGNATNASYSNFFGREAGNLATGSSFSTFIGYRAGANSGSGSVGSNNIIIGTNISLPSGTTNSINIGAVLFGTGTYDTLSGIPKITPNNGRIGINVVTPTHSLHVSGDTRLQGGLTANTLTVTGNTSLQGLTANTISATTYQNLPADIRITGATYSNNTFTYRNNTGGTFSVLFNTVTGLTANTLTVTGNTDIRAFTGTSGVISGTGQNILTVIGSGNSTTSPIFSVQGSQGELFSVTDSLTGSLFSVNDISGLPILEVFSDNTTLMGSYLAPSLNTTLRVVLTAGTNTVYSIPVSAYTGAFFDYTVASTGTTGVRAGTVTSVWSGSTAEFTDISTNDIGSTTGVTFSVTSNGTLAQLRSSATTSGWIVKTIIRSI